MIGEARVNESLTTHQAGASNTHPLYLGRDCVLESSWPSLIQWGGEMGREIVGLATRPLRTEPSTSSSSRGR